MKILEKATRELFYAGLSRKDYRMVREAVEKSNRKSVIDWSVSAGIFWIMSLLMSLNAEAYARCRPVYTGALASCAAALFCALFLLDRFPRMIYPLMYLFDLSVLGAGVGIALCQPDVRTVTAIAVAIIIPICFIGNTASCVIVLGLAIIAFAALGKPVIAPDVYAWTLLNLSIFSVAGALIGHVVNKARFERYVYAESVRQLADLRTKYAYYDQMTGLQNRRAYAEMLDSFQKEPPPEFCAVMADINGLKETNDVCGHAAGDELIIGAAECLRTAFAENDMIYRLGGDEFCVITLSPPEKARRSLERLKWAAANWKGRYVKSVSISYGMSSSKDFPDADSVVRDADSKMYEYKRNYYMESGKDRRHRRLC